MKLSNIAVKYLVQLWIELVVHKEVHPVDFFQLKDSTPVPSSKELSTSMIQEYCNLDEESLASLKATCENYEADTVELAKIEGIGNRKIEQILSITGILICSN